MQAIDIRFTSFKTSHVRSLCGFLGSFDPLHKGHEWIAEQLLDRFEVVLLLVPAVHFEKTVRFPRNATFEQRIEMLTSFARRTGDRIAVGLAHEVLFIKLADCLAEDFPNAEIAFGMGNETFERFLESKAYYERSGRIWTDRDQVKLEQLQKNIVVFGRSGNDHHVITVPEHVRWISSTRVRETVRELRKTHHPEVLWHTQLETMVSAEVMQFILQTGLYRSEKARPMI